MLMILFITYQCQLLTFFPSSLPVTIHLGSPSPTFAISMYVLCYSCWYTRKFTHAQPSQTKILFAIILVSENWGKFRVNFVFCHTIQKMDNKVASTKAQLSNFKTTNHATHSQTQSSRMPALRTRARTRTRAHSQQNKHKHEHYNHITRIEMHMPYER